MRVTRSTIAWFAFRFSGANLGTLLRKSELSKVVLSSIFGEEPSAQRAEWNEADPELLEDGKDLCLWLSPPQRVLALKRRDRLDCVRATDRLHAGFGKSEVPDLALLDQLLHRYGHVFDRHGGIDSVLVEKIDGVDLESPERGLGDLADVPRTAIQG
jgi:hypothetical protein